VQIKEILHLNVRQYTSKIGQETKNVLGIKAVQDLTKYREGKKSSL
jgi:hypothetical protein